MLNIPKLSILDLVWLRLDINSVGFKNVAGYHEVKKTTRATGLNRKH